MRYGQGMPVNIIMLVAIALLVLIGVAVFFITGFSQTGQSMNIIEEDLGQCNSRCQNLAMSARTKTSCEQVYNQDTGYTYEPLAGTADTCNNQCDCDDSTGSISTTCTTGSCYGNCIENPSVGMLDARIYVEEGCATNYGPCIVTISLGKKCSCGTSGCTQI